MRQFQLGNLGLILPLLALQSFHCFTIFVSSRFLKLRLNGFLFLLQIHALLVIIGVERSADLAYHRLDRWLDTTRENPMQGIIIFGWNGIELVIVAARA